MNKIKIKAAIININSSKIISFALYTIGAIFAFKALTTLDTTSLWNDEISTVEKSFQDSLTYLFQYLGRDTHPPLYYMIIMAAGHVFGKTVLTLRGISWLAYIAACITGSAAVRSTKIGEPFAALAFTLFASSPIAYRYSTEGKAYALLTLSICIYLLFRARISRKLSGFNCNLCGYIISLSAASLIHFYGFAFAICVTTCDLASKRKAFLRLNLYSLILPSIWTLSHISFLASQGGRETLSPTSFKLLESIGKAFLGTNWPLLLIVLGLITLILVPMASKKDFKSSISTFSIDATLLLITATLLISLLKPSSSSRDYIVALPSIICGTTYIAGAILSSKKSWNPTIFLPCLLVSLLLTDFWINATSADRNPHVLNSRSKTEHRQATMLGSIYEYKISRQASSLNLSDKVYGNSNLTISKKRDAPWISISDRRPEASLESVLKSIPQNTKFLYSLSRITYIRRHYQKDLKKLRSLGAKCRPLLPSSPNIAALECEKL